MTPWIVLGVVAVFALWVLHDIVLYLLERQDRYVAASLAKEQPVAAAIINAPTGPRNAKDEQKAVGANPRVPYGLTGRP